MLYQFPQVSQPGEPYSMENPVEYLKWSTPKSHVQLYCSNKMLNHLDVHISALFSQFRPCDICPERQRELFLLLYPRPSVHIIHEKTKDKFPWIERTKHTSWKRLFATYTLLVIHFAPVSAPTYPPQQKGIIIRFSGKLPSYPSPKPTFGPK